MALLEDIGRTNSLSGSMNAITNLAVGLRQQAISERAAGQNQAINEMTLRKLQYEEQQRNEEKARLDKPIPLEIAFGGLSPTARAHVVNLAKSNGFVETDPAGQEIIRVGRLEAGRQYLQANPKETLNLEMAGLTDLRNEAAQIQQQIASEEVKPKDKEALVPRLAELQKSIVEQTGYVDQLQKQIKGIDSGKLYEEKTVETGEGVFQLNQKTGRYDIYVGKGKPDKDGGVARSFLLPSGEMVLSYDGGRTYAGREGEVRVMPTTAVPVPTGSTLDEVRAQQARLEAQGRGATEPDAKADLPSAEDAARGGTGPYAMLAAATDRFLGGLGADAAFGAEGLFPNTQDNRQILRSIRQLGKRALINSPRFPTTEQKIVDKLFPDPETFFTNPRTEARKFDVLRKIMIQERQFNDQAIQTASAKDVAELLKSNQEIDRFLGLIGPGDSSPASSAGGNTTTVKMPDGTLQVFDSTGKRIR